MEKFAAFSGRRLFVAMCCLTLALSACKSNEGKPQDGKASADTKKEFTSRIGFACCNLHYSGDLDQRFQPWPAAVHSGRHADQLSARSTATGPMSRSMANRCALVTIMGGHRKRPSNGSASWWCSKIRSRRSPGSHRPCARRSPRGQLMKGMTREQVIMAVGHPQTDENPRLDGPYWRYWWSSFGPYYVYSGQGSGQQDRWTFRNCGLHDLQGKMTGIIGRRRDRLGRLE